MADFFTITFTGFSSAGIVSFLIVSFLTVSFLGIGIFSFFSQTAYKVRLV